MKKSIVLQSIDSPRRDMEWRLFMAAKLAKKGVSSIIGSKSAIRTIHTRSRNCVFLGRLDSNAGRTSHDKNYIKEMNHNGTALFFLHDEGALYFKGEYADWVKRIYPEELFSETVFTKVLFWGEEQKKIFDHSLHKSKFEVSGFPRFDLCKPEYNNIDQKIVSDLKQRYGNFILICGRFAAVNMVQDDPSSLGKRSFDIRVESGALETKTKNDVLRSMFDSWEKVSLEFSQFVPAVVKLALDFPDLNFVLRPHPAERESFYKDAFTHFDNIFIEKSGDVRPYIRACKAIIHSECTTGLEAELNLKTNINFRPCADHNLSRCYEVAGAADIGLITKNYTELHSTLADLKNNKFAFTKSDYNPAGLIKNSTAGFSSSDYICELIIDFFNQNNKSSKINSKINPRNYNFYSATFLLKQLIKKILGRLGYEKYKTPKASSGDLKECKFSDNEIKRIWNAVGGKSKELKISNNTLYISPAR